MSSEHLRRMEWDKHMDDKKPAVASEQPTCPSCNHSLKDNDHGFDQNDAHMEGDKLVHSGCCTYCKVCGGDQPTAAPLAALKAFAEHLRGAYPNLCRDRLDPIIAKFVRAEAAQAKNQPVENQPTLAEYQRRLGV